MYLWALALLLSSCSVKEYRGGCPAELRVFSMKYAEDDRPGTVRVGVYEGESSLGDSLAVREALLFANGVNFEVPRLRKLDVTAIKGIPNSHTWDSLYAGYSAVYFKEREERKQLRIPLRKEFCTVTIRAKGLDSGPYSFSFALNSDTDGISLYNLHPHSGKCTIIPQKQEEGVYRCRIPRQIDDSLSLSIFASDDSAADKLLSVLSIADSAKEKPDWNAPDLPDINIDLDLTQEPLNFSVQVLSWDLTDSILEFEN